MNTYNSNYPADISFHDFWLFIASEMGDAWLRLNEDANHLKDFIDHSYDPKEYLRKIILDSYKISRCTSLHDAIDMDCVLDLLGETAFTLRGERRDDLFDIELLEEVAWHIGNRFAHLLKVNSDSAEHPAGNPEQENENGVVVSFPRYRIRKANSRF